MTKTLAKPAYFTTDMPAFARSLLRATQNDSVRLMHENHRGREIVPVLAAGTRSLGASPAPAAHAAPAAATAVARHGQASSRASAS